MYFALNLNMDTRRSKIDKFNHFEGFSYIYLFIYITLLVTTYWGIKEQDYYVVCII